jgi:hypothetical protein
LSSELKQEVMQHQPLDGVDMDAHGTVDKTNLAAAAERLFYPVGFSATRYNLRRWRRCLHHYGVSYLQLPAMSVDTEEKILPLISAQVRVR